MSSLAQPDGVARTPEALHAHGPRTGGRQRRTSASTVGREGRSSDPVKKGPAIRGCCVRGPLPRGAGIPAILFIGCLTTCIGPQAYADHVRVRHVLDGDSVMLVDGREVRYLGINTPEAGEPLSEESRAFNRRLVEGKPVRLVRGSRRPDRYGRLLAYVYVGATFVNAELVRAGLAHLLLFRRIAEERTLRAAENQARAARRGLWARGGPRGPLKITSPRRGQSPPHRPITVCNISGRILDLDGYALEANGLRFRFPSALLGSGHVALVLRDDGPERVEGGQPARFRWQRGAGAGNLGVLTLRSPTGRVIDHVDLSAGRNATNHGR